MLTPDFLIIAGDVAAAIVETGTGDTAEAVVAMVEAEVSEEGKDDGLLVVDDVFVGDGDMAAGYLSL